MIVEIEVGGLLRLVTVEPEGPVDGTGGRFRLSIGPTAGQPATETLTVDVRRTDLGLALLYADGHRSVEAALTDLGVGCTLVQLPRVDLPVVVDGRRYRRGTADASETGEQRVTAPMPGRILKVLVAAGDAVASGQAVVVIEAMKMENELKVSRAGRVSEVLVSAPSSVEAGRLLVVVE